MKVLYVILWGLLAARAWAAAPVAWWSFDDPARLGRDSAGTNDAVLYGAPLASLGVRNGGISLNGLGAHLRVATSSSLEITGPMTILLWANANAVNANYPFLYKATNWDDGEMAYMLDLDWFSGGYYPRFAVSSDGHASGYRIVVSPEALTSGQWHLIAGVYDGARIMVYVDGQLKASQAYTAGIYAGKDPLCIGWNWNSTWPGALDEVRIFDVAVSPADILSVYQNEVPPLAASLQGSFGRVQIGQARTNQVILINRSATDVNVTALQVSGADAACFEVLSPGGGFVLHPGAASSVSARIRFAPDVVRPYEALLTIASSVNSIQMPLTGYGANSKSLTLDLRRRTPAGQVVITRSTFQGSQLAAIVVDTWNSHPDPEMASRADSLVPRMNQALEAARALGITVIFCPSDCLADYEGTSYRAGIMNLPYHSQGDNGFDVPLPPYDDSPAGYMIPLSKSVPASPWWTHQHPDLVMKPGDLASLSRQEIFNYCAENGITSLLYLGAAANMCVAYTREFSMIPMKRYCNLEPIMVRDLTESMTLNGRSPTAYGVPDLSMSPDRGHREVTEHNETYICSTVSADQLMRQEPSAAYTCLVSGQTNLLCYWRLDSKSNYRDNLDIQRTQTCWWYDQTNGLGFGMHGALNWDTNTCLRFAGSTTVLVSPSYRDDIPAASPLVSLSATNFTLEAWVQVADLNREQWIIAHDTGQPNRVDVLLGLNERNHFQFIVGTDTAHSGYGDVLESATAVTQADVTSSNWFHIVATHDPVHGTVALYINGNLDTQGAHNCQPVSLTSAPHFGSRGEATVDVYGRLSYPGYGFFNGTLDEVAIYTPSLSSEWVRFHYQTARGLPTQPVTLSATKQGDQIVLSWPAFSGGLWLQASDSLSPPNWDFLTVPVLELNGTNVATISATSGSRLFRLASQ